MKSHLYTLLLCVFSLLMITQNSFAQGIGINNDNSNPDASAMLDVKSTNKGVLIPRMTTAQRTTILSPATGLLVFDTTTGSFWYFNGTVWTAFLSGTDNDDQDLSLAGNVLSLTNDGTTVNLAAYLDNTDNQTLSYVGNTLTIANGNNVVIPNGDVTGITAGTGLTGGGTTGNITVNAVALNGLITNANDIRLGGVLVQATTISQGTNNMVYNLNSTGDFHIQDNGTNHFSLTDNGNTSFGGDVYWRDENTGGTILANLIDEGNDGRFIVRENGGISVDLDANTQFVFNEQGLNRDFRVESDANANMFRVDAGTNRVGIGIGTPAQALHVIGTTRISTLAGTGTRMVVANANGDLTTQAIASGGDSDFFAAGGTASPTSINNNIYTLGGVSIGNNNPGNSTLVATGNAEPSIEVGSAATYNAAESGRLVFEENISATNTSPSTYCGFSFHHDGAANELYLSSGCTGAGIRMTVERGGQIGMSTDNPTANLSVNGTANKTGGGTWAVFSDARLKENVSNYTEGLDFIKQVRTVNFSYNSKMEEIWGESPSTKGKVYQGVIAQELQKIAPDMVNEVVVGDEINEDAADYNGQQKTNETYLEVDPNKFTYALINAVKEQQAMIEKLEKELNTVKAQLNK